MSLHRQNLLVVLSSFLVAGAIGFTAFDVLRDTASETRRTESLTQISDETRALHILSASAPEGSKTTLSQAQNLLRSQCELLKDVEARTAREVAVLAQLRTSFRDLDPLIDEWLATGPRWSGAEGERPHLLASQIWLKAQFIADDIQRLRDLSRARLLGAQRSTAITIVALIGLVAVTNVLIYALSLYRLTRAQRELVESQRDLSHAQTISRVGSWYFDVSRNELRWSDECYRIAGIPKGTPLTYESFLSIVHPDDRDLVDRSWQAALRGEPYDVEHRIIVVGETRWAREQAELERDAAGTVVRARGAFHDITDRKIAERSLHEALADTRLLHRLTLEMAETGEPSALYERLMDAAVEIMRSDFASLQMLDRERGQSDEKGELELLAHRGFPPETAAHWKRVRADSACTCGIALATGQRCDVMDVHDDPRLTGKDREVYLATGMRAVQTTPLIARDGRLLGAISTHWKQPRDPDHVSARDWRMLDVLARHAADLLERRRIEQAVLDSEQRIRQIIEQLPAGVGVMDRTGRWVLTNPLMDAYVPVAVPSRLGDRAPRWRAWDAQGQPVPPEHWPGQRALRGEIVSPGLDMLFRTEDGQDVWMRVGAAPLHDPQGRIIGATCVVRNVDAVKRAEQAVVHSEQRFRSLVGVITDVPWVTDPAGAFIERQPAWEAYTGQSWQQSCEFGWLDAVHVEDRERIARLWREACASKTNYESNGRVWHAATSAHRHFVARATPVLEADGSVREWVGSCTDVHEQREVEESLRRADRRKDEFLATLAHELRNPLAPIRTAARVMQQGPSAPQFEWARGVVERQMQHMTRLIDDLLDVSRVSRGVIKLERKRVTLAEVIESAAETSRPAIEQFGHELVLELPDEPIPLESDLTRLAQVFANLLNNAAKYTDPGGVIRVTARRDDGQVVVSVADSGIGIARDQLCSVFELFSQVHDGAERAQGGLGIGLALSKRLVEMHDGAIEARSEGSGRGSVFVVRLPIAVEPRDAIAIAGPCADADSMAPRRILIVDDNRDAADSLEIMLSLMGNEIRTAYDGEEALEAAESFRPEVILLDIGLPKLNGYETCRSIRSQLWGKHVSLIAVTGWGQDEDRRKTEAAGFDRHLIKLVDTHVLVRVLASLPKERWTELG